MTSIILAYITAIQLVSIKIIIETIISLYTLANYLQLYSIYSYNYLLYIALLVLYTSYIIPVYTSKYLLYNDYYSNIILYTGNYDSRVITIFIMYFYYIYYILYINYIYYINNILLYYIYYISNLSILSMLFSSSQITKTPSLLLSSFRCSQTAYDNSLTPTKSETATVLMRSSRSMQTETVLLSDRLGRSGSSPLPSPIRISENVDKYRYLERGVSSLLARIFNIFTSTFTSIFTSMHMVIHGISSFILVIYV